MNTLGNLINSSGEIRASHANAFRFLASQVADLGQRIGVRILPFRSADLPIFRIQEEEKQRKILSELETYLKICKAVLNDGRDLKDAMSLTWYAIKEFGFRPVSDLFSYMTNDNVIEIHESTGIQIFRNFKFYEFCSYSLEELHCLAWSDLYSRNEDALSKLFVTFGRIYSGELKTTTATGIVPHIIEELYSPFKYKIHASQDYLSPLFDVHNRAVATVAIETGVLIGHPLSPQQEEDILKNFHAEI